MHRAGDQGLLIDLQKTDAGNGMRRLIADETVNASLSGHCNALGRCRASGDGIHGGTQAGDGQHAEYQGKFFCQGQTDHMSGSHALLVHVMGEFPD